MYTTTHYGLNIVEGTDVVNPLVQQNPNFEDIDTAMFENKQASIGSATELTAGTVHTITRANTDSNYIRFTATSNWTAGDSMVIDATPVSVFLSDGTAPKSGAYVINTEVLVLLNGTRATMFVSSNKTDEILASVTADGVKDYATIYGEIYAAADLTKVTYDSKIVEGNNIYVCDQIAASGIRFVRSAVATTLASISEVKLASASTKLECVMRTSGNTLNDESTSIPTAGTIIALIA